MNEAHVIWLTFKLATTTTLVLLVLGTPLAWWLARGRSNFHSAVEAVVALPLILAFIMFSLGLGLRKQDFTRVLKFPKAFGTGILNQLVLLPLIAFGFVESDVA